MSSELTIFENEQFGSIRTVKIDSTPYFVGKDVAEVLGYSNPQKAIRDHVDDEDKGVNEMDTPGGKQNIAVINESGQINVQCTMMTYQTFFFSRCSKSSPNLSFCPVCHSAPTVILRSGGVVKSGDGF